MPEQRKRKKKRVEGGKVGGADDLGEAMEEKQMTRNDTEEDEKDAREESEDERIIT